MIKSRIFPTKPNGLRPHFLKNRSIINFHNFNSNILTINILKRIHGRNSLQMTSNIPLIQFSRNNTKRTISSTSSIKTQVKGILRRNISNQIIFINISHIKFIIHRFTFTGKQSITKILNNWGRIGNINIKNNTLFNPLSFIGKSRNCQQILPPNRNNRTIWRKKSILLNIFTVPNIIKAILPTINRLNVKICRNIKLNNIGISLIEIICSILRRMNINIKQLLNKNLNNPTVLRNSMPGNCNRGKWQSYKIQKNKISKPK